MISIAYILESYPCPSKPYLDNEILALENQGADVLICSLGRPDDSLAMRLFANFRSSVMYLPQLDSGDVFIAHHTLLIVNRLVYLRARRSALSSDQSHSVEHFLQAGVIAKHLLRHPVNALHTQFDSSAARVANYVNRLIGLPVYVRMLAEGTLFNSAETPMQMEQK